MVETPDELPEPPPGALIARIKIEPIEEVNDEKTVSPTDINAQRCDIRPE